MEPLFSRIGLIKTKKLDDIFIYNNDMGTGNYL